MKLFHDMANQAFMNGPDGERLFCTDLWSRPAIVPNKATEERLFKKQLWLRGIFFVFLIISQPVYVELIGPLTGKITSFLTCIFILSAIFRITNYFLIRGELRGLKRMHRITVRLWLCDNATRYSRRAILFHIIFSLLLLVIVVWLTMEEHNIVFALMYLGLFGAIFLGSCCTLYFKVKSSSTKSCL